MRTRTVRHLSRIPVLRLCLEFLEDRRLLSRMAVLPDVHLSRPSEDLPSVVGPMQPSGPDGHARTFVQPAHAHAPAESGEGAGAQHQASARPTHANATKAVAGKSDDNKHSAPAANTTDRNEQNDTSDETKHAESNTPSTQYHTAAASEDDAGRGSSRQERPTDEEDSGRPAGVATAYDRPRAERSFDGSDQATQTDRPAKEATAARAPAVHTVATTGQVETGYTTAQRASFARPSAPRTSAAVLEKALADGPQDNQSHDQHAARSERVESPAVAPAREGTPELDATAVAAQASSPSLTRREAEAEADRQAGILKTTFLASGTGEDLGLWGLSVATAEHGEGEDAEPRGAAIHFAAGVRGAHQVDNLAGAAPVSPDGTALAAGALSADTSALEEAVRQFLNGLHTVGRELTRVLTDNGWARWAVIATLTALAAESGRRRLQERARRGAATEEEEEGVTLSWLSGSYPFRPDEL